MCSNDEKGKKKKKKNLEVILSGPISDRPVRVKVTGQWPPPDDTTNRNKGYLGNCGFAVSLDPFKQQTLCVCVCGTYVHVAVSNLFSLHTG